MYFKDNQRVGILLLFVLSHVVVKMAEPSKFEANTEYRFLSPKSREQESKLLQESIPKSSGKNFRITPYIYYACRIINYVCALLYLKTIPTPLGIEYIH